MPVVLVAFLQRYLDATDDVSRVLQVFSECAIEEFLQGLLMRSNGLMYIPVELHSFTTSVRSVSQGPTAIDKCWTTGLCYLVQFVGFYANAEHIIVHR